MYRKHLTLEELISICKAMKGMNRKESLEYGAKYGLTLLNVDCIRQMLGYSDCSKCYKFSAEERDAIAEEYKDGGVTMADLARKYGVRGNAIRGILLSRDVTIVNNHKYTKRQEMYIRHEYKRGTPVKKIAEALGKSEKCIRNKIKYMSLCA